MRTLYEIGVDLAVLNEKLSEVEGDLSRLKEMEGYVSAWLDQLGGEQAAKLDRYVGLIRQLEMEASAAKAEAEQWAAKAKGREARVHFLKERLKDHLAKTGQAQAQTESGRVIAMQANGGQLPVILDVLILDDKDFDQIPEQFVVTRRSFDMAAVRKALEGGKHLGFAHLGERGSHLRIR